MENDKLGASEPPHGPGYSSDHWDDGVDIVSQEVEEPAAKPEPPKSSREIWNEACREPAEHGFISAEEYVKSPKWLNNPSNQPDSEQDYWLRFAEAYADARDSAKQSKETK